MAEKIPLMAVLFSISLLQMSGMNISPALQTLSRVYPNESAESIQTLVTLPSLFMVLASFLASPCSRLFSKKRTILFGCAFFSVAGLIPMVFTSFSALRFSRMLIGAAIGLFLPINSTLLFSFFTDPNERNTVIGWQSCASASGNIIATTVAGMLVQINYKLTFLVHLIGVFTFIVNLVFLPQDYPEKGNPEEKKGSSFFSRLSSALNRRAVSWLLVSFMYMTYLNCFSTKISLLVESQGIGTSTVSALGITIFTVGSFSGGLFYGKTSRLFREFTLPLGFLLSASGILLLGTAHDTLVVYISSYLVGLGMSMVTPGVVVGLLGNARPDDRIMLSATSSAVSNLGLSLSPYITSFTAFLFLRENKSLRGEYVVCASVLMLMAACASVRALVRIKKNTKDS